MADTKKILQELEEKNLLRAPMLITKTQGRRVLAGGKGALQFCSNDYLGLSTHPALKEATIVAAEKHGTGAGASRLVSGTTAAHLELEKAIKEFMDADAALVFNSGWHANTGIIPALASRETDIFTDKLDHASIIDGCLISRATLKRYPHGDAEKLNELLQKSSAKQKIIITDGLFSMDGDIAPLEELVALYEKYNTRLIIDDAHGIGALGKDGRGSIEELGMDIKALTAKGVVVIGTFGKAFGSYGAFALADVDTIKLLTNKARSFIYSTALPPTVCAASIKAIEIVRAEPERRQRLKKNARKMRDLLNANGTKTIKGSSQIIPIIIGKTKDTTEAADRLLDNGIFIQAIRPPTVIEGAARLRLTISSEHTAEEITEAAEKIQEAVCAASM
jgi:glycine C-acetyltransferase